MNHIGEFDKESTILLELLTKSIENHSIIIDYPPTATIEHYSRNGLVEVDSVRLEVEGDPNRYKALYTIPNKLLTGNYLITYKTSVKGKTYKLKETFSIRDNFSEIHTLENDDEEHLEEDKEEETVTSDIDFIMPSDYQIPSEVEVIGNKIIITISEEPLYNHTYRTVLKDSIKSTDGDTLGSDKTVTFTSKYEPVFATPLEVRSILKSMYKYFKPHDIYVALKNAGQKAMQMLGNVPDPNNDRYRELRDSDSAYFPIQKYSVYEASRALMTNLMVRIIDGDGTGGLGGGMMDEMGGSIKLGDFTVTDPSGGGGTQSSREESTLEKLKALLKETENELKFWQDAMMGHNKRGYAKPVSTSFRVSAGSPEGRDF